MTRLQYKNMLHDADVQQLHNLYNAQTRCTTYRQLYTRTNCAICSFDCTTYQDVEVWQNALHTLLLVVSK